MLPLTTPRILSGAAALAFLQFALALAAQADGPNNSTPNTGPPPPAFGEVTNFPQLPNNTTGVVDGTCKQQYTNAIDKLWSDQVSETTAQLAFEGTAAALPYPLSTAPAAAAVAAGGGRE